jgi:hypothetical protein
MKYERFWRFKLSLVTRLWLYPEDEDTTIFRNASKYENSFLSRHCVTTKKNSKIEQSELWQSYILHDNFVGYLSTQFNGCKIWLWNPVLHWPSPVATTHCKPLHNVCISSLQEISPRVLVKGVVPRLAWQSCVLFFSVTTPFLRRGLLWPHQRAGWVFLT